LAYDDVIQYPYIDERQRGLQLLGQHTIRARRLGDAEGCWCAKITAAAFNSSTRCTTTRG
jgi:hypothetical protein